MFIIPNIPIKRPQIMLKTKNISRLNIKNAMASFLIRYCSLIEFVIRIISQILNMKNGTKIKQHPIIDIIVNCMFLIIPMYIAEMMNNINEIKEIMEDIPRIK